MCIPAVSARVFRLPLPGHQTPVPAPPPPSWGTPCTHPRPPGGSPCFATVVGRGGDGWWEGTGGGAPTSRERLRRKGNPPPPRGPRPPCPPRSHRQHCPPWQRPFYAVHSDAGTSRAGGVFPHCGAGGGRGAAGQLPPPPHRPPQSGNDRPDGGARGVCRLQLAPLQPSPPPRPKRPPPLCTAPCHCRAWHPLLTSRSPWPPPLPPTPPLPPPPPPQASHWPATGRR